METKDTAVALLKEWKYLSDSIMGPHGLRYHEVELASISRRLDEISGASGISIINGQFAYDSESVWWQAVHGTGYKFVNLPAREQQAIQEWLLIKNEEKPA